MECVICHNDKADGNLCEDCIKKIKNFPPGRVEIFQPNKLSCRGSSLVVDAHRIINGDRVDQYGEAEDSFEMISVRWNQFLKGRGVIASDNPGIEPEDVGFMLADMKFARQCHAPKRDNFVDAVGYLALTDDIINK